MQTIGVSSSINVPFFRWATHRVSPFEVLYNASRVNKVDSEVIFPVNVSTSLDELSLVPTRISVSTRSPFQKRLPSSFPIQKEWQITIFNLCDKQSSTVQSSILVRMCWKENMRMDPLCESRWMWWRIWKRGKDMRESYKLGMLFTDMWGMESKLEWQSIRRGNTNCEQYRIV